MPSHKGSEQRGSPTAPTGMSSSSSSRMSMEGSLNSHCKYRIKVIAQPPLPSFKFLAPYEPGVLQGLEQLQRYIYEQLSRRATTGLQGRLMGSIDYKGIRLEMDGFEIPFNELDIIRDGDTIEACLDAGTEDDVPPKDGLRDASSAPQTSSEDASNDSDESEASDVHADIPSEALLEGERIAALLKAGYHRTLPDDEDTDPSTRTRSRLHNDFPAPPALSSPSNLPCLPLPPMRGSASGTGSAAAAMAAFQIHKSQRQSGKLLHQTTNPLSLAKLKAQKQEMQQDSSSEAAASTSSSSSSDSDDSMSDKDSGPGSTEDSAAAYGIMHQPSDSAVHKHFARSSGSDSDSSVSNSLRPLPPQNDSYDTLSQASSSSSSAPSEEAIKRQPTTAASAVEASGPEKNVPPGKGTSRTRRRNLLRRKKLQLIKEAGDHANFVAAKRRAELRERGDSAIDTRTMKGSKESIDSPKHANTTASVLADASPPIIGALLVQRDAGDTSPASSVTVAAETSNPSKKRKRQEASPDLEIAAEERVKKQRPIFVRTVPPSELPRDQIPACITITSIDCEEYYETELRKLEAQQDDSDVYQPDRTLSDQARDLDYGDAENRSEISPGKRIQTTSVDIDPVVSNAQEQTRPDSTTDPSPADRDVRVDASDPVAKPWSRIESQPPLAYLEANVSQSFELDGFIAGAKVVFRDIALHPLKKVPEMMTFVGVVQRCSSSSIELDVRGPLFSAAQWDELEIEPRTWTLAYHPDEIGFL